VDAVKWVYFAHVLSIIRSVFCNRLIRFIVTRTEVRSDAFTQPAQPIRVCGRNHAESP
jgi:hypothetical protein